MVQVFGCAQAHHGYLFANARATRIKLLVQGAFKSIGRYFKRPCHSSSDPIGDWRVLSEG